jgi:flagellar hook-associated protein 2
MDVDQASPNFGLFVVREGESDGGPFRTLDEALANDPRAVAEIFAADGVPVCNSQHFSYSSQIRGTTKPGVYKVSYDVVGGEPQKVMIGGVPAIYDAETGEYTCNSGPGRGLAIKIDYLADGRYTGDVGLKQGKIGELNEYFKEQLTDNKFTNEQGTLIVLKNNYRDIMDNITKKIEQENIRITNWERTQRLKFARLDTLLGQYDSMLKANEAAFKQISSNSGK